MFTEDMEPKALPRAGLRQGLRRGRGLRPRLRPAPARRRASRCCGSPTSSARASHTRLTDYFSLPVVPDRVRLRRRGCSSSTRTTRCEALRLATTGEPGGIVNVAGDGVLLSQQAARLAGRPVGVRPAGGRRAARPVRPAVRAGRLLRGADAASSPSAGASTPPGCARCCAWSRGSPPGGVRRLRRPGRHRPAGPGGRQQRRPRSGRLGRRHPRPRAAPGRSA